jgi:uncharacterized protein YndB with AHSA1/START domain
MSDDVVTVERVLPASPERIFSLLADPRRHHLIDGSGHVKEAKKAPRQLERGSEFGMAMHWFVPYAMKSRVVEYEENRRIAWQTVPAYPLTDKLFAGRIWRYELEPVPGGTLVKESWDISKERFLTKPFVKNLADMTRKNMEQTLERIEQVLSEEQPAEELHPRGQ